MKPRRIFDIAFVGLKEGLHRFSYDIDDQFFVNYAAPDFTGAQLHVELEFDKSSTFFLLKFEITGSVTAICDRCGDPLQLNIWDEFKLAVKLVEDPAAVPADDDPDVAYISKSESLINVADWIYEFSLLSVPMQRVHSADSTGQSTCNKEVLRILGEMQVKSETEINPIWKDLDKFKNN